MPIKVGLISDTHGKLRSGVFDAFDGVQLILHAGDIGASGIITELETIAPVRAVHGNTDDLDIQSRHPASLEITVESKRLRVEHGHLLGSPNPQNLRARYVDADVIVYGHTHKPLLDVAATIVVNPGAAGPARFNLKPSVAVLELPSLEVTFVPL